jgi:tetratricopeptide (TPR) repeat protein
MSLRTWKHSLVVITFLGGAILPAVVVAQGPPGLSRGSRGPEGALSSPGMVAPVSLDITVRGPDGAPIQEMALVTLSTHVAGVYKQATTMAGHAVFEDVVPTRYNMEVVAPGFEKGVSEFDAEGVGTLTINVELRQGLGNLNTAGAVPPILLAPKAQKEMGKALQALRADKLAEARTHLEAAYRLAPNHPGVNYLFGIYWIQSKDLTQAKSYLTKTIELSPTHAGALLSFSEILLHENKVEQAIPYLERAVEAEPSLWRAHAVMANARMQQGSTAEAIKDAERALELGHGQAAMIQPLLARALAKRGDIERAKNVLQDYVKDHPGDTAAKSQLQGLQSAEPPNATNEVPASASAAKPAALLEVAAGLPKPLNWRPPDVDEKMPPVESGAACVLDEVVQKAGNRVKEFLNNVDRFTASESLKHEAIDKWGLAGSPAMRKFDYLVAVEESKSGLLNVQEYRGGKDAAADFPDGVATIGLPALVLIFHPYYSGNYEMTCEGLTDWNGGLAWQVHFRQRPDKPNTIRAYRLGFDGPSYATALKGRAWILADSFQIARLETDLVAPIPQIRLVADHTAIEYGPVQFRNRKVELWLPQSAELYYDWKGQRIHRRHSFSNYLLFAVDDRQRISVPKTED